MKSMKGYYMTSLREYLQHHKLVTDGSFGTFYAAKYGLGEMPEIANIKYPFSSKNCKRNSVKV